jgi:hypothetical protein
MLFGMKYVVIGILQNTRKIGGDNPQTIATVVTLGGSPDFFLPVDVRLPPMGSKVKVTGDLAARQSARVTEKGNFVNTNYSFATASVEELQDSEPSSQAGVRRK